MRKAYLLFAVTVFLTTALLKISVVLGKSAQLDLPDRVLEMLSSRQLLFIVACCELFAVYMIVTSRPTLYCDAFLAGLTSSFVLYRILMPPGSNCGCLGGTSWLSLEKSVGNGSVQLILGVLLVGAYAMLLADLMRLRGSVESASYGLYRQGKR